MEAKISAKELMDIVADTNRKVSYIAKEQRAGAKKSSSKIASAIVSILSVLGVALSALIFFPEVWELLDVKISEAVWGIIYITYTIITLVVSAAIRVKTPLRIAAVIVAIAPISIYALLNVF